MYRIRRPGGGPRARTRPGGRGVIHGRGMLRSNRGAPRLLRQPVSRHMGTRAGLTRALERQLKIGGGGYLR